MFFNRFNGKSQITPFFRRNVMKMLLTISVAVLLIFAGVASAACPSMDITGDCRVNFDDIAIMAANWLIDCNLNPTDPACVPK